MQKVYAEALGPFFFFFPVSEILAYIFMANASQLNKQYDLFSSLLLITG